MNYSPETSLYRSQPPAPLACQSANLNGAENERSDTQVYPSNFSPMSDSQTAWPLRPWSAVIGLLRAVDTSNPES